jgi:hypothetical protein
MCNGTGQQEWGSHLKKGNNIKNLPKLYACDSSTLGSRMYSFHVFRGKKYTVIPSFSISS